MASTASPRVSLRMPAVSSSVTGTPATTTDASTTSRVVPAMSVTMALSERDHALSNELFPALGRPTIATETPVSRSRPRSAVFRTLCTASRSRDTRAETRVSSSGSSASSKSSRASSSAKSSTASRRARRTGPARPPRNADNAPSAAAAVRADTKPCTASACVKSRRPFRNARSVNSPGRARRTRTNDFSVLGTDSGGSSASASAGASSPFSSSSASRPSSSVRSNVSSPFLSSSDSTLCTHTEPPCAWISTTSSVV